MDIFVNGKLKSIAKENFYITNLLEQFDLNIDLIIVEVNQNIIKKEEYSKKKIHHRDKIEIIQFIGGG